MPNGLVWQSQRQQPKQRSDRTSQNVYHEHPMQQRFMTSRPSTPRSVFTPNHVLSPCTTYVIRDENRRQLQAFIMSPCEASVLRHIFCVDDNIPYSRPYFKPFPRKISFCNLWHVLQVWDYVNLSELFELLTKNKGEPAQHMAWTRLGIFNI